MIVLESNYSKKIGLPQYSSHQFSITLRTEIHRPHANPGRKRTPLQAAPGRRGHSIKALGFGLVNLDMYDEVSPVVFHHGGQRMVVMPIRLDAGSPPPATQQTPAQAESATAEPTTAASNPETQPTEERNTMPKTTEAHTAETRP